MSDGTRVGLSGFPLGPFSLDMGPGAHEARCGMIWPSRVGDGSQEGSGSEKNGRVGKISDSGGLAT